MGRLRARLARSPVDRELHTHLGDAVLALRRARNVCAYVRRRNRARNRISGQHIQHALRAVEGIGHLTPANSYDDPDFFTEGQRQLRIAQEALRRAAEAFSWGPQAPRQAAESRRAEEVRRTIESVLTALAGTDPAVGFEPDLAEPETE